MHSSQEMVDYRNECSQNQIFWVEIGALNGQWTSFEVIWVRGQKPLELIAGPFGTALNANIICQKSVKNAFMFINTSDFWVVLKKFCQNMCLYFIFRIDLREMKALQTNWYYKYRST